MRVPGVIIIRLGANPAEVEVLVVVHPDRTRVGAPLLGVLGVVGLLALQDGELVDVVALHVARLREVQPPFVVEPLRVSARRFAVDRAGPFCASHGLGLGDFGDQGTVVVGLCCVGGFAAVEYLNGRSSA